MSAYHLAQLNIAWMKAPLESPEMADFVANLERINALAEGSPGYVWRLQDEAGDVALAVAAVAWFAISVATLANVPETFPVYIRWFWEAMDRGATMICVDPRETSLARVAQLD